MAELPFTLMHPKPLDEDRPSSSSGSHKSESSITNKENGESSKPSSEQKIVDDLVDTNLIQLDPWVQTQNWNNAKFTLFNFFFFSDNAACYADQDDDIIFEDFARLRLKGETDAWGQKNTR